MGIVVLIVCIVNHAAPWVLMVVANIRQTAADYSALSKLLV